MAPLQRLETTCGKVLFLSGRQSLEEGSGLGLVNLYTCGCVGTLDPFP